MRVGLLGGSFNPPHHGHVYLSELAIKKMRLHQVWWLPARMNPIKKIRYESLHQRILKCERITSRIHKIRIKPLHEVITYRLVRKLIKKERRHRFFWIMGADNLESIHNWESFAKLIRLIPFGIFARDKFLSRSHRMKSIQIYSKINRQRLKIGRHGNHMDLNLPKFLLFQTKALQASSTHIRNSSELYSM